MLASSVVFFGLLACAYLPLAYLLSLYESILQSGLFNSIEQQIRSAAPENNSVYDFIIVGGGAAGCVLANELLKQQLKQLNLVNE